jgi:hypothetical protein
VRPWRFQLPPVSPSPIPPAVSEAANSVFLILVPKSFAAEEIAMNADNLATIKQQIQAQQIPDFWKQATLRQIAACERRQHFFGIGDKPCVVSGDYEVGTAFLMEDAKTLWTAKHVVDGGMGFSAAREGDEKSVWPIFIFNSIGQLLVDSLAQPVRPKNFPQREVRSYMGEKDLVYEDFFLSPLPMRLVNRSRERREKSDRAPFPNAGVDALRISAGSISNYSTMELLCSKARYG